MITNIEQLYLLAEKYGIATKFWGYDNVCRTVSEATIRTILDSFDVHVDSDVEVAAALKKHEDATWQNVLPPCVVTRSDKDYWLFVHVPHGREVRVYIELDNGEEISLVQLDNYVEPRRVDGELLGRATFLIPSGLPLGWYTLRAEVEGVGPSSTPVAITPGKIHNDGIRRWGMATQLYSLYSPQSWGMGDAADLADVGTWAAQQGADFLLINPLHAGEVIPPLTPSPYLPSSRRFLNPIYIRPTDIPEFSRLDADAAETVRRGRMHAVKRGETIDRDSLWGDKFVALELIYAAGLPPARERMFELFLEEQGEDLENYALWCALLERGQGKLPNDCQSITDSGIAQARRQLRERIRFFSWMQWIIGQQIASAQAAITACGMEIGVMHDLAIGVHSEGADVWGNPDLFAVNVTVGAPPDMYNAKGQNWSQPPMRPDALERDAYEPVRAMARTMLNAGGALRIDHVMGLFRLWWIPRGEDARQGTYVRYNHEAMVGVIALEAELAGATIVGEDLGTVEPWVRTYLEERGFFGTAVVWFERTENGEFKSPNNYRVGQLATVNTHDLPPTMAQLDGTYVDELDQLGLLDDNPTELRAQQQLDHEKLINTLVASGELESDHSNDLIAVIHALHRWVAGSAAQYFAVSIVDLVGERARQNIPGTDKEFPNWRQWLHDSEGCPISIEQLCSCTRADELLREIKQKF